MEKRVPYRSLQTAQKPYWWVLSQRHFPNSQELLQQGDRQSPLSGIFRHTKGHASYPCHRKPARSEVWKEGRRLKLEETVRLLSPIFKDRFSNAHALLDVRKDLTNVCANALQRECQWVGWQWSSLDINVITQKNKYKVQKLKFILPGG